MSGHFKLIRAVNSLTGVVGVASAAWLAGCVESLPDDDDGQGVETSCQSPSDDMQVEVSYDDGPATGYETVICADAQRVIIDGDGLVVTQSPCAAWGGLVRLVSVEWLNHQPTQELITADTVIQDELWHEGSYRVELGPPTTDLFSTWAGDHDLELSARLEWLAPAVIFDEDELAGFEVFSVGDETFVYSGIFAEFWLWADTGRLDCRTKPAGP